MKSEYVKEAAAYLRGYIQQPGHDADLAAELWLQILLGADDVAEATENAAESVAGQYCWKLADGGLMELSDGTCRIRADYVPVPGCRQLTPEEMDEVSKDACAISSSVTDIRVTPDTDGVSYTGDLSSRIADAEGQIASQWKSVTQLCRCTDDSCGVCRAKAVADEVAKLKARLEALEGAAAREKFDDELQNRIDAAFARHDEMCGRHGIRPKPKG
ncbi:hypothetical protein [Salipiger abyssi]|uniref:Uncharacterized protein n=1 Tax=Salipiger abyssi TaxID=1250539 RepID=A0A1P8UPA3_9RHOB|nr:hypothetical protein [Salipiger abyssi]APZ51220.1 hypothetical protein Ga0080574_TMP886 [Salipiger abyssi]